MYTLVGAPARAWAQDQEMTAENLYTTDTARWNAVVTRDEAADGAFFYAVKTTGVFCRPGCASRQPRRRNVEFFATADQATAAGYRPCKRCSPTGVAPQAETAAIIVRACRRLEEPGPIPTLAELAAEAHLSQWHFQRLFKKTVGVTPRQYAAAHRADHFRDSLAASDTVTEAIYEAGFGSSSRAYDHARERLAMTPSTYKRGAAGETIRYGIAPCYLGWVIVAATERGICAIQFGDAPEELPAQVLADFPEAQLEEAGPEFSDIVRGVVAYLEQPAAGIDLPLDIQGTAFQERVWSALREIPAGATASYGEIAARIGQPRASRAVAQACAANKLAGAIPCHRVVRGDGSLSGYRWGTARKQALLRHESGDA